MAEEKKEPVEEKVNVSSDTGENKVKGLLNGLNNSPIGGLFGGRPWILLIVVALVIVILLIVIIASLAGRKSQSSGRLSTVEEGTLTVGIVVGADRYAAYENNGSLSGIEPELVTELAEAEGLGLKMIEADTVDNLLKMLDNGEVDMAIGRISTSRAVSNHTISDVYGQSGIFFVTTLHDYTDSLDLMSGYSAGIMNDVAELSKELSGYLYISPHDYTSIITLGEDIVSGKISFGLCNERDAITLVKSYPNDIQLQQAANGPKEQYVAVFRGRNNPQALIFNAVISDYMDNLAIQ